MFDERVVKKLKYDSKLNLNSINRECFDGYNLIINKSNNTPLR